MSYVSIFDPIPWNEVGVSALQTFILYWVLLLGLKAAGRRVFGELGPQDLMLLLIVAESTNLGLAHEEAGFWGAMSSVLTVLLTGAIGERIRPLQRLLEPSAIELVKDGVINHAKLKKHLVEEEDLLKTAREYGLPEISMFASMTLEGDGSLTGVPKLEHRWGPQLKDGSR